MERISKGVEETLRFYHVKFGPSLVGLLVVDPFVTEFSSYTFLAGIVRTIDQNLSTMLHSNEVWWKLFSEWIFLPSQPY